MSFNSYIFVLAFLPITLVGYFALNRLKNREIGKLYLLAMSLWFYTYANWRYTVILLFSVACNYFICSMMSSRSQNRKIRRTLLILGILFNVLLLFYFKYFNFFISSMNSIFHQDYPLRSIFVPLGISFFTFQQLSYLIDLYTGRISHCGLLDYLVSATFFPVIISGPITLHGAVIPQLNDESRKHFSYESFNSGLYLFTIGLGKKVLIADTLGKVVDAGYSNLGELGSLVTLYIILAYSLQLYFDFSGYSDMARGVGRMLNIDIQQNFNLPYRADSIRDFWKRWHITLTQWLTCYIYYPLGGNRKGKARTYLNIMIVFLVSGIWHGANYTFIIWGLLHGIAQCISRACGSRLEKLPKGINVALTFIFVNLAWIVFRAPTLSQALQVLQNLFSFHRLTAGASYLSGIYLAETRFIFRYRPFLDEYVLPIAYLILAVLMIFVFRGSNSDEITEKFKPSVKAAVAISLLLAWCILSFSSVGTFIYSNF